MNVIFLDRDGTIIVEPPDQRVDSESKIQLFPDTIEALKYLADHDYSAILITNQMGIAEGLITEEEFERLNNKVIDKVRPSGIKILKTYFCPHKPEDNCGCRKPNPKMILDAATEFNIDPSKTYMIGDRQTDILAGINAGTKTILVQTAITPAISKEATYTAANLLAAVKYAVNN